jgi:hypothetical protein
VADGVSGAGAADGDHDGDQFPLILEDFFEKKELVQWIQGNISAEVFQESLLQKFRNVELIFEIVDSYDHEMRDAFKGFINGF